MSHTDHIINNNNESPYNQHETSETVVTKLCHIIKRPDFNGYGFNLHSEKAKPGQYIGKVDVNSPAEHAGLKEGDRIISVNGVPIGDESHKQVVIRIKAIANEVRLLLVDGKTENINEKEKHQSTTEQTSPIFDASNRKEIKNEILENNLEVNSNVSSSIIQSSDGSFGYNGNGNKVGSLQLPITAAEMRAKLLSKKKYDPKNESVDLKKKFEIIQKL